MPFDRARLPEPEDFYRAEGLTLAGRGTWRSAPCVFHGSRATLRVNLRSGAYICMAGCGARGGDVLAYRMAVHGEDFTTAARKLGAWVEADGAPPRQRPTPFPARDALHLLATEAQLVAVAAANVANGSALTRLDLDRLLIAARRISKLAELFP